MPRQTELPAGVARAFVADLRAFNAIEGLAKNLNSYFSKVFFAAGERKKARLAFASGFAFDSRLTQKPPPTHRASSGELKASLQAQPGTPK